MKKIYDEAWAEEMLGRMPPAGYKMTLSEGCALVCMADRVEAVAAAYNYGFQRGLNFARNAKCTPKPTKRQGNEQ